MVSTFNTGLKLIFFLGQSRGSKSALTRPKIPDVWAQKENTLVMGVVA